MLRVKPATLDEATVKDALEQSELWSKTLVTSTADYVYIAMERLHSLHFVTSKKVGAKYAYSITDKGVEALKKPLNPTTSKDKEAGSVVKPAASNPSPTAERPANTDIQCPKCHTFNPFSAIHCKECGTEIQGVKAVPVAA